MATQTIFNIDDSQVAEIVERVYELKDLNQPLWSDKNKIRNVMNGGAEAYAELLGPVLDDQDAVLPVANLLVSANQALGQKLGAVPTLKVDPPSSTDSDSARKRAAKKLRIVAGYDENDQLDLQLPQVGRWLPGYGLTAWTVQMGRSRSNDPIPVQCLRDPFETLPAQWGPNQQPEDLAFVHVYTPQKLLAMFRNTPEYERIRAKLAPYLDQKATGLPTIGQRTTQGSWANQRGAGLEVYEYLNDEATWWLFPEANLLLSRVPNPLESGPAFYVAKRYAFDRLIGQYDQSIGLLAAMARLNLLLLIAVEDAVHAPVVIQGDLMTERWETGRDAVNVLMPGSSASYVERQVPFQAFQNLNVLERQLRLVSRYPVTDDAQSPNSFVTGRGLAELNSSVDNEVREYQTILSRAQQHLDAKKLEFDERVSGSRSKTIHGIAESTPFSETYRPSRDINGDYVTRRKFGVMASWDEPTKIITGLQLLQAGIIDRDTFRENLDGLENLPRIEERLLAERSEDSLFAMVEQLTAAQDPRAVQMLLAMLPDSDLRAALEEIFAPEQAPVQEPQMAPELAALTGQEEPPDTQTLLSRLTTAGQPFAGAQLVQR